MAWLAAGYPEHVPSTTIDRKCGSSQQAGHFAAHGIMAGEYDVVIACGVESMSRIPMGKSKMGQDSSGPRMAERYAPGLVSQGISAEIIAARWGLDRELLDRYSVESHRRAEKARAAGQFRREICAIITPAGLVEDDETIRGNTTMERLASLKPAFENSEMIRRFPQIGWHVTARNASQITDGAAAMLLMSERTAARLGLRARARFVRLAITDSSGKPVDLPMRWFRDSPINAGRLTTAIVGPASSAGTLWGTAFTHFIYVNSSADLPWKP